MDVEQVSWNRVTGWSGELPRPDGRETLLLAFGASELIDAPTPFAEIADVWGDTPAVGCSTPFATTGDDLGEPDPRRGANLALSVLRFDHSRVVTTHVSIERAGGSRRAARRVGNLLAEPSLQCIVMMADGMVADGSQLATGMRDVLPDVTLTGGLAADDRFTDTWTLVNGMPRRGWVSAFGLVGDHLEVGAASMSGWESFSQERVVTRSYGNVLYELNGRPAIEIYQNYLGHSVGGLADSALGFPLALRDLDGRTVVRSLVGINTRDQGLRFTGDVPQGSSARLMCASSDDLIHHAQLAAKRADLGADQVAFACSGTGRRRVLGDRSGEEWNALRGALTPQSRVVGLSTMGELSADDGETDVRNQSMSVTTIRELTPAA
jgi:hypothetical protein